ncbi:TauD/TfdA family dioxygenase [Pigmentiphaga soli]|uniref:TauD/TfdA family dioxygenase n=1 Tax=Pigmentiphaga soli TaxID=1007095 RepID=A0ABP8GTV3_9BURK
MRIERADAGIGAIVSDIDLNRLGEEEWAQVYRTWLDAKVMAVRGQHFDIEQFLGLGRRFGRLKPHRVRKTRHPDYPELTRMGLETKTSGGTVNQAVYGRGDAWHTDGPWDQEVCKATQLYGLEIPSVGGDTLFSDMQAAYEALPESLRARIDGLDARFVYGGRTRRVALLSPEDRDLPPAVHPVVKVHPETGRRSLYINPVHFLEFVGMERAESDALAEELFEYLFQPGAQYRHQWKQYDYVIWDNRCLIHAAAGGYPLDQKRIHWRSTIMEQ